MGRLPGDGQAGEIVFRQDPGIGAAPGGDVHGADQRCIGGPGAADGDQDWRSMIAVKKPSVPWARGVSER